MYNQEITFIQPKHSYASKEGLGQVYLPSSILSMKSRLLQALNNETKIKFIDENIEEVEYENLKGIVGINLLGSPYIPIALDMIKKIPENCTILLGGQIVGSFSQEEFQKIFCKDRKNIFNGNDTKQLENIFMLEDGKIPALEEVDFTKAYQDISDEQMKDYLGKEFSVYLSQGCKYTCSFCQAQNKRTSKEYKSEKYRNLSLLKKELVYLGNKANDFGLDKLEFYLSNLDLLQTPNKFGEFLDIIEGVKKECPSINFKFRALCGVDSFYELYKKDKELLQRAKKLGLTALGYGVDGATAEVRKSIGKSQNFSKGNKETIDNEQEKVIETIKLTNELGITPEALMVFGHPGETEYSIKLAYEFCKDMYEKYGAIPRPHISKTIIPGTKARSDKKNKEIIDGFIENPEYFQALDYTALPSELTHPDEKLRRNARKWYIKICDLSEEATKYIIPNTAHYKKIAEKKGTTVEKMNEGKFDK